MDNGVRMSTPSLTLEPLLQGLRGGWMRWEMVDREQNSNVQ